MMAEMTMQEMKKTSKRPMGRRKRLEIIWLVTLQIIMTIIVISFLIPTLWMISSSLKHTTEVFVHPIVWIPVHPQWKNYIKIFDVLPFAKFAWNTLIVTGLAVLGTLVSSAMVGYSFARLRWPGRQFFFALMVSTMMLPEIVTLVPRFIEFRSFGWIDTFYPLTAPYWFAVSTLYVFLIHQFFRGLPMELEEAALIDGANRIQILTRILLPLAKPVIATIIVFSLIQHYNAFLEPLIYLNGMEHWTLALGIRAINDSNVKNWELVFAAGTLMFIPVFLLFAFAQRYFVQGIALTGFGGR
ncbi:MAG TPA: sugar ABC transporter ATP-binding protein [Chloroflexi bacterium]|nr:sugar ABC transporter ATP-binding protein [Chloroflexota bacterium]